MRQRIAIVALLLAASAGWLLAATRPVSDAKFGKLTCRSLEIVDSKGKARIKAGPEDGQLFRLSMLSPTYDPAIDFCVGPKTSALIMTDENKKERISALINDNSAILGLLDRNAKPRISAGTSDDGRVFVPIVDLKMNQVP